jgi:phytoene/squalene synthetase
MPSSLAASVTKKSSKQTYYMIRFLADRERVEDAFRAYAYFRWVDDCLDMGALSQRECRDFVVHQQSLLKKAYQGQTVKGGCPEEQLLIELVQSDPGQQSGLHAYLHDMMALMAFDASRQGRLISQQELDQYTGWLASSVTEALHYFIGHDSFSPHGETRYLAVTAAHITHMLRDTVDDARAGYFNIPVGVLEGNQITPADTDSAAYRAWVQSRVELARSYFRTGRSYIQRVESARCRLAGFAYVARFEWLLDTIEREGFHLRPSYEERKSPKIIWQMGWLTLISMLGMK